MNSEEELDKAIAVFRMKLQIVISADTYTEREERFIELFPEIKAAILAWRDQEVVKELEGARIDWMKYADDFRFDPSPDTLKRIWNGAIDHLITELKKGDTNE